MASSVGIGPKIWGLTIFSSNLPRTSVAKMPMRIDT